jgi:Holliday junction resolvase RusA-like endonuclease
MIVSIRLHPRVTKTGEASQVRVDIDNAIKCALDAGNLLLWADDKQVVKLYAEVADPIPYGGLTLEAHPLAA